MKKHYINVHVRVVVESDRQVEEVLCEVENEITISLERRRLDCGLVDTVSVQQIQLNFTKGE